MTGVDITISIIFLSGLLLGIIRGFVGSVFDVIGTGVGILIASQVYRAPATLFERFNITGNAVNLVCFLFTSLIFVFVCTFFLDILRKRVEYKHIIDRILGIFPGTVEGMLLTGIVLIAMSVSFNSAMEVQQSRLSKYILKFLPPIYEKTDPWKINIPKMVYIPAKYPNEFNSENKEIYFKKINFSQWAGFTCMECGGKVRFDGYFLRIGAAVVPKFTCEGCGRISDGCQTYEGFHKLYNTCPVEMARQKARFDCGRWPNHKLISPKGPCPVDGKSLDIWEWEPPTSY
ncbi:MAG: CvpA family protein [Candidatus Omnitrophica bacterium]|nr:CvpA family protein [Candidatus Omnitrophota bacterium]MCM8777971.1 CvpA family protein [Candidatus Omnitrophota bacterium]